MARKLRIEEAGGLYHVINRGNYRRDLFESPGSAAAFLRVLFEAAEKFHWHVHAYVLMRNHFHLAVETVEPTLGEGMHWLQGTMAVRFNRRREERGHLFQGRYKAMPIEDTAALARVVDYIHLNPARAKVMEPQWLLAYRWSSLHLLLKGPRPPQLRANRWLEQRGGWPDSEEGIRRYGAYLVELAKNEASWEATGVVGLSQGWAIGSSEWMQSLAKIYEQTALSRGLSQTERAALRQATWEKALGVELRGLGRDEADLASRPRKQAWKLELAQRMRDRSGVSIRWLAERLQLGQANTLRGYLHQLKRFEN
jgi:putative transposase